MYFSSYPVKGYVLYYLACDNKPCHGWHKCKASRNIPALCALVFGTRWADAVGGFEIQSYGMVIHPDGTAHYYVCGDVSPEKKAKIEAQMKAEDEEKAKRRRQYLERSEEAAEKRRQIEEINMQKSKKDAAFDDNISAVNVLSEVDRAVAIAAYENIANTFNENIIKSTIDN